MANELNKRTEEQLRAIRDAAKAAAQRNLEAYEALGLTPPVDPDFYLKATQQDVNSKLRALGILK